MVNNFTNINKTKNYLSYGIIKHTKRPQQNDYARHMTLTIQNLEHFYMLRLSI